LAIPRLSAPSNLPGRRQLHESKRLRWFLSCVAEITRQSVTAFDICSTELKPQVNGSVEPTADGGEWSMNFHTQH
jgi:hypothetical protein